MPACPRVRRAGGGGEHPTGCRHTGELAPRCPPTRRVQALLRVSVVGTLAPGWDAAQGWDTAQCCLPRCPAGGETCRWHPCPRRWTRPTWSSSILLPRGFLRERGCRSRSRWIFSATGSGACCSSESISYPSACPSHRKNVPAAHGEGGGPCTHGCPGTTGRAVHWCWFSTMEHAARRSWLLSFPPRPWLWSHHKAQAPLAVIWVPAAPWGRGMPPLLAPGPTQMSSSVTRQ